MSLEDFIAYLASEKGLSQNTLQAYRRDVERYLESKSSIIDFLGVLKAKGYKSSSLARILIAIKVYHKFLKREGLSDANEAALIPGPKLWRLIPEVLSLEEIEKLIEAPDITTQAGARDAALLELLYASGLRVSEICALKITDVDDTFIKVKGKGSKERIVPVGQKAKLAIDHWLLHYRDQYDENPLLFLTEKGKPLNRIFVWKQVKYWAKQVGITKNISPHTLRHTFATHLLDHGADIRIIQEMLGHANISSTDRYTHIRPQGLQAAFNRFHPRP